MAHEGAKSMEEIQAVKAFGGFRAGEPEDPEQKMTYDAA